MNCAIPFQQHGSRLQRLTLRDVQVIYGIACGLTVREISDGLNLHPRTVQDVQMRVILKCGIEARESALVLLTEMGVLSSSDVLDFMAQPTVSTEQMEETGCESIPQGQRARRWMVAMRRYVLRLCEPTQLDWADLTTQPVRVAVNIDGEHTEKAMGVRQERSQDSTPPLAGPFHLHT